MHKCMHIAHIVSCHSKISFIPVPAATEEVPLVKMQASPCWLLALDSRSVSAESSQKMCLLETC